MVLVVAGLWITACATAPAATPGPAGPVQADLPQDYRLGAGDKVRVITYNEPTLTGEFDVSSAGYVSLPLIGEVRAKGLTTTEFQNAVAAALKAGYLKDPRVSAEVLTYRPFYIMGEVNKPGEYPYAHGMTVLKAVATANGFTYRADTRRVFIKRSDQSAESEQVLGPNTLVNPGDTIRIGERFF
ncbi:polysaccharide biosynthesis/export family protein [Caulobacter endophyticus]|uniref:polysaccharide biosynthesis/export family protein n=1 Tax=Caulobacter endophyticus TaxID=2172652 RepID=UPI003D666326